MDRERATGTTAVFKWVLIGFAALSAGVGIGFIAFGFALQSPARSFVPVCLILIGCVTLIASVFGYVGARFKPSFLFWYMIAASVATGLQLLVILVVWIMGNKIATNLQLEYNSRSKTKEHLKYQLEVGRWLIIACIFEIAAISIALFLHLSGKVKGAYADLTAEEAQNLHTVELNSIKTGMGKQQHDSGNRLAAKMQAKYGGAAMEDFMKGRRWYNFFSR